MSTPTSSPSSTVRKRVIASPRNAQDLKLRLGSVDNSTNGPYGLAMVSPLTDLMTSSPSQMQALTPELNGRRSHSPSTAWSLSSNLLSNHGRQNNSTANSSNNGPIGGGGQTRSKAPPPALDLVSPTAQAALHRHSASGQGRSSLPELFARKDGVSNSVDVSTERCALSPSSVGNGRSSAFTPTFESSNPTTASNPPRVATAGDGSGTTTTTTPPPSAPRMYSKRSGGGSRESAVAPPQRPSLGSGLRTNTSSMVDSPTRHGLEEDLMAFERTGDLSLEYEVPRAGRSLSDYQVLPTATHGLLGISTGRAQTTSSSTPSAPTTPAVASTGRSAQVGSILATSGQTSSAATNLLTPTIHGTRTSDGRVKSSRAPRLASHLFLDSASATANTDSAAPAPSLQSPAVKDEARRRASRSSSGHGRLRSSRGSSDGRVSISTESSTLATTPALATSRPNALNFARGELIGKGSFGAVYRGMQRNTNRIICMKEIRLPGIVEQLQKQQQQQQGGGGNELKSPVVAAAEDMSPKGSPSTPPPPPAADAKEKAAVLKQMESVKRELALLKQLNHPNIVKYLNDEIVDGCLRIYMEYVSGGSVASAVKTYGAFEEPQAAALCYQLLQGLSYLHSRGIVHRDLKGDNLLLETSSELKIADFGTAKSIIASATMTANIVGTAYFMAPEVLRPEGLAGTPADIWSTACCVIEMLTGKPPLSSIPNQYSVMMTIAASPKVPLDKYIPADNHWSPEVLDFVTQCLQLNASSRPTAQELLQHPWIAKYCDVERLSSASPATLTSATTPTITPVDRLHVSSAPLCDHLSLPNSPDAVLSAATPNFTVVGTPTASPRLHSRSSSNMTKDTTGTTPHERKSKKDKRSGSSKRQHSRELVPHESGRSGSANTRSTHHNTPLGGASLSQPRSVGSNAPLSLAANAHNVFAKPSSEGRGKQHYTGGASNLSMREDDRQQSFTYEYPTSSMRGGMGETPPPPSTTTFLPAIACASNNAINAANVAGSMDGTRTPRLPRHGYTADSSREVTRAYHYPHEDDFLSRESMRVGRDYATDGHDFCRDLVDGSVHYGSTARLALPDTGLDTGMYSTLDCLRAPPNPDELQPSAPSRRSTSKKAGRGTL